MMTPSYIQQPIVTVGGKQVVKRYLKLQKVGRGSYSDCYLVRTEHSTSTYVVKVIPKAKLLQLTHLRLNEEIRIHQQLSHPHVVHLDHWFEDSAFQYIFLEACAKGNLEDKLMEVRFGEHDIRHALRQILPAVQYLHSRNILHRDLKPCNFYIDDGDNIKLGDFGFACQLKYQGELKRDSCGTPNFIAPEAISGFGYSHSSDVWSIGVMIYRMMYRMCPFEGQSVSSTLQRIKTCRYTYPAKPTITKQLKHLLSCIFMINYDERITLQGILNHQFMREQPPKRKLSLRNILRKEPQKPSRNNSCQNTRHMKEILKCKSKPTLPSFQTQPNFQDNISLLLCSTNGERVSKINQNLFESKIRSIRNSKPQQSSNYKQLHLGLILLRKKHLLPSRVQMQSTDIKVVSLNDALSLVLHREKGYLHCNHKLYDCRGNSIPQCPKIIKYVVEGLASEEPLDIIKYLPMLPQQFITVREGVILKYSDVVVGKTETHSTFCLGKQEKDLAIHVLYEEQSYKVVEGAVIARIYLGWITNAVKGNKWNTL